VPVAMAAIMAATLAGDARALDDLAGHGPASPGTRRWAS
jgi:hypothetical protein